MKHPVTHLLAVLTRVFILVVLILTIPVGPIRAESSRIVVLGGQDSKPYQEVLTGLQQALAKQGITFKIESFISQGNQAKTQNTLEDVKRNGAKLVVTLGSQATQAAAREIRDIPILASMIITADDIRSSPNATAVLLDFSLETQFQWMKRIVPNTGSVGVLFNPKENQTKIDGASKAAKGAGLTLVPRAIETPHALPDALDDVTRTIDVLWGIPDSVVMTPQTAEPILLSTLKNKVPLVGLSRTWVKAGALYALDRDYVDIGQQCGEIAVRLLQGTEAKAIPVTFPRKVMYSINLKTAGTLNLELSPDLIRGAEQVFQ
jgi:putative tryptophan/tyrosine transport system substrate-binding protein